MLLKRLARYEDLILEADEHYPKYLGKVREELKLNS